VLALLGLVEWDRPWPAIFSKPAFASPCSTAPAAVPKSCGARVQKSRTARQAPARAELSLPCSPTMPPWRKSSLAAGASSMLKKGAIHLSMSTITVALSERLTEAHRVVGQHFVAVPVFGRPEAAAAAKLYIVAAGAAEPLDRCQPLFDTLGQKTFIVGELPPISNLIKLTGIFWWLGHRVFGRGDCADAQVRRRSAPLCRDPDR
jgi:3-hydroxyisobutyrate dehydrogenase-like beta-hydroxyacid dehydrogenase